jgi:hypothetical protein
MRSSTFLIAGCLILLVMCTSNDTVPKDNPPSEAVRIVTALCEARAELSAGKMEMYIADDFHSINDDGSTRLYDREMAKTMCEWERVMHAQWTYQILGVNDSVVTVLLKETNDYYTLLGLGAGVQVSEYVVANGKVNHWTSKLFITEKGAQSDRLTKFKEWLLSQPGINEPTLLRPDSSLIFDDVAAPRMLHWLKQWNKVSTPAH